MARHVRKGDTVMITRGESRGQVGVISRVLPDEDRVVVQGLNLRTKHLKPTRINPQGGIVTREAPVHISNVSPVVDGRPTRVRFETRPDGSKVRVAARNGKELSVLRGPREGGGASAASSRGPGAAPAKKASGKKAGSKKKASGGAKKTSKKKSSKKKSAGKGGA